MCATSGFWHVGLTVRSLDQSLDFYQDGLGLEFVSRGVTSSAASVVWGLPGARAEVMFLRIPGSEACLELFQFAADTEQYPAAARPWDFASSHFCLYVDDLDSLHQSLAEKGYRSRAGAVTVIPDGPLAGAKVAYLIDPDGHHVELFERAAPLSAG